MIQIRNGKLGVEGASLSMPERFYLDTMPDDQNDHTVNFYDETMEYKIQICFDYIEETSKGFLEAILDDMEADIKNPMTKIEINGLKGYYVGYISGKESYFEACLSFEGEEYNSIDIIITGNIDFNSVLNNSVVKKVLACIQKEK